MSQYTDSTNYPSATTLSCHSNGTAYAVSATLTGQTGAWCVDSTGTGKVVASSLSNGQTACP